MKTLRLFLTGLLLMAGTVLYAQDLTVTGTVTDAATGETVIGAAVQLQGSTTVYTMTDDLGNFSISVPQDGVLIVSFLGFRTKAVPVNGRTEINVEL